MRVDVPRFGDTAFPNPAADALTFRDQDGSAVKYNSGGLPDTTPYWSPRVGFNYDVTNDQKTQLRGGTGLFSGKPPYVWISNQIGNTGVLYGFTDTRATTAFPFNPNPDKYKPARNGRLGGQLRAQRDGRELPLPADVADQHRRRSQAARGDSSARSTTSTTAT